MSRRKQLNPINIKQDSTDCYYGIVLSPRKPNCDTVTVNTERDHLNDQNTNNGTAIGKKRKRKGKKNSMTKLTVKMRRTQKISDSVNKDQLDREETMTKFQSDKGESHDRNNNNKSGNEEEKIKDVHQEEQSTKRKEESINKEDSTSKNKIDEENEDSLQCPVCKKIIQPTSDWISHVKRHGSSTDDHTCVICEKTLSSSSSLDRHMLVHSGKKPFKCKFCFQSFTTNGNMHRHIRTTHSEMEESNINAKVSPKLDGKRKNSANGMNGDDSISSLSKRVCSEDAMEDREKLHCPVCGKTFLCNIGLQTHMETHPNNPIQCQECGDISSNYSSYRSHKCCIIHERKNDSKPFMSSSTVTAGFHQITFVDFSIEKFGLIAKSFCEHNPRRPSSAFHAFQCSKCDKAFPCRSALNLHENVHSKSPGTYCPSCNCDFPDSFQFQAHQLKHRSAEHCTTNDKEEIQGNSSPDCKQIESRKEDFLAVLGLQRSDTQSLTLKQNYKRQEENFENLLYFTHGKSDSASKSKTCKQDTNGDFADIQDILSITSNPSLLNPVHSTQSVVSPASPIQKSISLLPESPLPADSASPDTPSKETAEHPSDFGDTLSNSASGSHLCINCNQSFKNAKALKRHRRLHSQDSSSFSCTMCNYISLDKSTLIRHLRTHNGERPFQCSICKYAFTTKANCERHIQKKHKKMTKQEICNAMEYNPNMSNVMPTNSIIPESSGSETVCKYCNVDFKASRHLRHHLRSLNNSCHRKPYLCKTCNIGFSTKNNCHRHIQNQHPDIKEKVDSIVIVNGKNNVSEQETAQISDETLQENCSNVEPLNLMRKSISPPVETTETIENNSDNMDERASIATSLLTLSQLPTQEEALDLAVRPLDLRQLQPHQEMEARPVSIYPLATDNDLSSFDSSFLDCSSLQPVLDNVDSVSLSDVEPLCLVSRVSQNVVPFAQDVAPCQMTFKMVNNRLSHKNKRPFNCRYCPAGFTLKSNMERHIKRKHPEYARPPRSRNYLPTLTPPNVHRQTGSTLSTRTRDALREVLNNKNHNLCINNQNDKRQEPEILLTGNITTEDNHSITKQGLLTKNIPDNISPTCISLGLSAFPRNHQNNTLLTGTKGECENQDLASVSDVIDTANSQEFKQYFKNIQHPEKSRIPNDSNSEEAANNSENLNLSKDSNKITTCTKKKSSYANSRKSVPCPFCHRKFPWTSSLRRHILTHTGHKPYKCPRCPVFFTTKSNCERHLSRKHGQNGKIARSVPERPYKCNICSSSTFATQGNLRKHYYVRHCRKTGNNMKQLGNAAKIENDHAVRDEYDFVQENETESNNPDGENGIPVIYCQYCNQPFSIIEELLAHIGEHAEADMVYKCHLCDDSFIKRHDCINHLKSCHLSEYELLLSKEVIVEDENESNELLNTLVAESDVTNEQPKVLDYTVRRVVCIFCFNRFWSNGDLKRHMRTHTGERPFACNVCNRTFTLKHSMVRHLQKHFSVMAHSNANETNNLSDTTILNLKRSCSNSLLHMMYKENQDNSQQTATSIAVTQDSEERDGGSRDQNEGSSDLIQNLLGINDSTMLDRILDSADSAARILGVNEIC